MFISAEHYPYLVSEVIHGNHVHHNNIIGIGPESREADVTMWKHSPEKTHNNTDELAVQLPVRVSYRKCL